MLPFKIRLLRLKLQTFSFSTLFPASDFHDPFHHLLLQSHPYLVGHMSYPVKSKMIYYIQWNYKPYSLRFIAHYLENFLP